MNHWKILIFCYKIITIGIAFFMVSINTHVHISPAKHSDIMHISVNQYSNIKKVRQSNHIFYYIKKERISVKGSQLAKIKKGIFPTCLRRKIYWVEAVGLKNSNYTYKIMILVGM